uniref:Uncharacterized protein n=1 Tax=Crocodylus porosus TaxID=8502 RepID=A0A7M4ENG4_CROPO
MATAAYGDHFAAECLVSMSNRAIIHSPRGEPDPRPDAAVPLPLPSNGEEKREESVFAAGKRGGGKAPQTKEQTGENLWQIFPSQSSSKDPHRLVPSQPKVYSLQLCNK